MENSTGGKKNMEAAHFAVRFSPTRQTIKKKKVVITIKIITIDDCYLLGVSRPISFRSFKCPTRQKRSYNSNRKGKNKKKFTWHGKADERPSTWPTKASTRIAGSTVDWEMLADGLGAYGKRVKEFLNVKRPRFASNTRRDTLL